MKIKNINKKNLKEVPINPCVDLVVYDPNLKA